MSSLIRVSKTIFWGRCCRETHKPAVPTHTRLHSPARETWPREGRKEDVLQYTTLHLHHYHHQQRPRRTLPVQSSPVYNRQLHTTVTFTCTARCLPVLTVLGLAVGGLVWYSMSWSSCESYFGVKWSSVSWFGVEWVE